MPNPIKNIDTWIEGRLEDGYTFEQLLEELYNRLVETETLLRQTKQNDEGRDKFFELSPFKGNRMRSVKRTKALRQIRNFETAIWRIKKTIEKINTMRR